MRYKEVDPLSPQNGSFLPLERETNSYPTAEVSWGLLYCATVNEVKMGESCDEWGPPRCVSTLVRSVVEVTLNRRSHFKQDSRLNPVPDGGSTLGSCLRCGSSPLSLTHLHSFEGPYGSLVRFQGLCCRPKSSSNLRNLRSLQAW